MEHAEHGASPGVLCVRCAVCCVRRCAVCAAVLCVRCERGGRLEDVRRELGDVGLQNLLEGREEHALEGVHRRGRRGADVAHERRDGLEQVVVERRVGGVGADTAEDGLELLDAHVSVPGQG